MTIRSWLPVLACLAVASLCAALLGVVRQSTVETAPVEAIGAAGMKLPAIVVASPVIWTLDRFPETLQRPIFSATRRPFVPAAEPPPPEPQIEPPVEVLEVPSQPPQGIALRGVSISASGRKALVASSADPSGTWMAPGDSLESWSLSEIGDETAVFKMAEESIVLHLYVKTP